MLQVEAVFPAGSAVAHVYEDWARQVPGGCRPTKGKFGAVVTCEVQQDPYAYLHLVRGMAECNRIFRARSRFKPLYASGVRYSWAETPGRLQLLSLPVLYQHGYGACGDLSAARASENPLIGLHFQGVGATSTGGRLYHVVVRHPDGSIEDPSAALGGGHHLIGN